MKRFIARVLLLFVLLAEFALNVNSLGASSSGDIPFISIIKRQVNRAANHAQDVIQYRRTAVFRQ